jgi:hypothetical protein
MDHEAVTVHLVGLVIEFDVCHNDDFYLEAQRYIFFGFTRLRGSQVAGKPFPYLSQASGKWLPYHFFDSCSIVVR